MSKRFFMSILLVTGILAGSASAQSLVPIDPATVSDGHVYLMDNLGGNLPDDSPNGNDGNIIGAPQTVAGINGQALQFDGVGDGIHLPDAGAINLNTHQNHVVIAVFNCDDVSLTEKQVVYEEGGTTRGLSIYVHEGLIYVGGWNLGDYTPDWNPGTFLSAPIGSGEWHVVAAVLRGGTAAQEDDKFEMWLDGELIAKGPGGELRGRTNDNGIGYHNAQVTFHDGGNSTTGHYFGGIIDEVWILNDVLTEAELRAIALNRTGAKSPDPGNDGTEVPRDGALSWEAGIYAQKHNVYLGTGLDDVTNATVADPLDVLLSEGHDATTADPGRLAFDQTYYWRVDEVNGAPDFTVFKGDVWNFTIEPLALPITNLTATASSEFGVSVADKTIDGSGLTGDLHSASANDMWISTGIPASLSWAFDRAYKLHEMRVWNSNQTIEPFLGFGAKDVVIEHSLDGENWTVLEGASELAQATGVEGSAATDMIDFGGVQAQHVRMNINAVHGFAPQASLSEVRFLYIPTFPTGPNPVSGAANVSADVTLSWNRDGREAAEHDIYLGTDPNALSLAATVQESSFDTLASDLALGQTFYWQVVEVNDAMDPSEWAGDVWSFTTVDVISVDDMESYRDEEFLEIWATWIDGFDDPGNNGAVVGANPALGDFSPESTITYGGGQSLPIHFDNSGVPSSEATRTFDAAMDWTGHGVQSLVLFFRGSPATTGGQLYVKVNDTKIAYDGASSDLMHLGWNKWTIPLSSVSASTLSRVTSMTIGIEGNGAGVVYVDEIQLTEDDTRVVVTPTDPSDEALVAHYAFDGDASDSTGQSPGTLVGLTTFVPGKIGQALRVDGIDGYVAIDGLIYDSTGLTEVTVTVWMRTDSEAFQNIVAFDRNEYWRLEINGDGAGPGQVGWDVMTDTGQVDYGSSSRVDDGEWHHLAGVFDNGTSMIFIDGYHEAPAMGGSTFGTGTTRYGFVGSGSEATTFNGAVNGTPNFFIGDLDDVRIYQRALSASEVAGMAGRTEPFEQP